MNGQSKKVWGIMAGILAVIVVIVTVVLLTSGSDSGSYQKHMDLAQRYMDELDYKQAIAEYEEAIAIEPNNAEVYQALAQAYIAIGDYESALDVLNRGVAQTNSEALENDKGDILGMVDSPMDTEQGTDPSGSYAGASESGEDHSVSEEGDSVLPESTEETDIAKENDTPVGKLQDVDGTVTILITWDSTYDDDGSLREIGANLTGKMDDGTALLYDEDMQAYTAGGALAAEMETTVSETRGSIQITLYRTDGFYNLEVDDGIGFVMHNTNGLSNYDVSITMVDGEGESVQVDVDTGQIRSYTGLWYFGMGIDHGMLAEYDSSWME